MCSDMDRRALLHPNKAECAPLDARRPRPSRLVRRPPSGIANCAWWRLFLAAWPHCPTVRPSALAMARPASGSGPGYADSRNSGNSQWEFPEFPSVSEHMGIPGHYW